MKLYRQIKGRVAFEVCAAALQIGFAAVMIVGIVSQGAGAIIA